MSDIDTLCAGKAWVNMRFTDGTVRSVHTTLNSKILAEYGVENREDHFFDLDRGIFVHFRTDATDISVTQSKPEYDEEVLQFASRFI